MSYTVINGKLQKVTKNRWTGKSNLAQVVSNAAHEKQEAERLKTKGRYLGLCNRSACLAPGASWYNRGSYAFYCTACAHMLNHANRNDEFCRDEPLCRHIGSAEECADFHVSPSPYSPQ